jgi:hypothetical protein
MKTIAQNIENIVKSESKGIPKTRCKKTSLEDSVGQRTSSQSKEQDTT